MTGLGQRLTPMTNTLARLARPGPSRPKSKVDLGLRKRGHEPINWQFWKPGERNERMVVERVFSVVTVVNHLKKIFHRVEKYLSARFGSAAAMFNCLIELAGGKLALAQFSL